MTKRIRRFHGPAFAFLVIPDGEDLWERRGRVRRVVGLKGEYFSHPEAFRLPMGVVDVFVSCFTRALPEFNYSGVSVFAGEGLDRLVESLAEQARVVRACRWKREFAGIVTSVFVEDCRNSIGPWQRHWPHIREEVAVAIEEVAERAAAARREGGRLLVLGV